MADELPGLLPAELARHVRAVSKTTNNMGAVSKDAPFSLTQTDDAYWLPSMSELCGAQGPETFSKDEKGQSLFVILRRARVPRGTSEHPRPPHARHRGVRASAAVGAYTLPEVPLRGPVKITLS